MPNTSNGKYPIIGGARWSRNRNFHSRLCREVNSDFVLSITDNSRINCGVWRRPVPTKTNLREHKRVYCDGSIDHMFARAFHPCSSFIPNLLITYWLATTIQLNRKQINVHGFYLLHVLLMSYLIKWNYFVSIPLVLLNFVFGSKLSASVSTSEPVSK